MPSTSLGFFFVSCLVVLEGEVVWVVFSLFMMKHTWETSLLVSSLALGTLPAPMQPSGKECGLRQDWGGQGQTTVLPPSHPLSPPHTAASLSSKHKAGVRLGPCPGGSHAVSAHRGQHV